MTKTIEVIMPKKLDTSLSKTNMVKLRVAAYARVSTEEDDQANSFKAQIDEYTERISSNPEWEFIGMFADKGITGTQAKKRPEFMRMVELGMEGKIDLILVKSISRFSRNTVDVLTTVRELRNRGCIIFFEKENIRSDDTKIDFVLTVLSSVAQEESRSISTNVKWSVEKKFKNGIAHVSRLYGYRKSANGELIINETEANVVRLVYSLFIEGYTINDIVKILNDRNIRSMTGKKWPYSSVRSMLQNEKYIGDAILQKTCTPDYLTHKSVKNDNIEPKYYVSNHHEGIIKKEDFETVQSLVMNSRSSQVTKYPLTKLVYCDKCHRLLHRHLINHRRPSEFVVLNCNHNPTIIKDCSHPRIAYDLVYGAVKDSLHELIANNDVKDQLRVLLSSELTSQDLASKLGKLRLKLNALLVSKEKGITNEIIEQEKTLRKKILELENSVSSLVRSDNLLQIVDTVLADDDFTSDDILIKSFYKLVVASPEELVMVISNRFSTEELVDFIDNIKDVSPLFSKIHIDYELKKGIKYRVVFYA